MRRYPLDRLYEEVAFIAYYFHWSHDEIMAMAHEERRRWCHEISKLHRSMNDEPPNVFDLGSAVA